MGNHESINNTNYNGNYDNENNNKDDHSFDDTTCTTSITRNNNTTIEDTGNSTGAPDRHCCRTAATPSNPVIKNDTIPNNRCAQDIVDEMHAPGNVDDDNNDDDDETTISIATMSVVSVQDRKRRTKKDNDHCSSESNPPSFISIPLPIHKTLKNTKIVHRTNDVKGRSINGDLINKSKLNLITTNDILKAGLTFKPTKTTNSSSSTTKNRHHPVTKLLDEMNLRHPSGWLRRNEMMLNPKGNFQKRDLTNEERNRLVSLIVPMKHEGIHYVKRLSYAWGVSPPTIASLLKRSGDNCHQEEVEEEELTSEVEKAYETDTYCCSERDKQENSKSSGTSLITTVDILHAGFVCQYSKMDFKSKGLTLLDEMNSSNPIGWLRRNETFRNNWQLSDRYLSEKEKKLILSLVLLLKKERINFIQRLSYAWGIKRITIQRVIEQHAKVVDENVDDDDNQELPNDIEQKDQATTSPTASHKESDNGEKKNLITTIDILLAGFTFHSPRTKSKSPGMELLDEMNLSNPSGWLRRNECISFSNNMTKKRQQKQEQQRKRHLTREEIRLILSLVVPLERKQFGCMKRLAYAWGINPSTILRLMKRAKVREAKLHENIADDNIQGDENDTSTSTSGHSMA